MAFRDQNKQEIQVRTAMHKIKAVRISCLICIKSVHSETLEKRLVFQDYGDTGQIYMIIPRRQILNPKASVSCQSKSEEYFQSHIQQNNS